MALNWGNEVEELGGQVLDGLGGLVYGYGATARNNADLQRAEIDRINLNNQLAIKKAEQQQETNKELISLFKKGLLVLGVIAVAWIIYKGVKDYYK